MRVLVAEDDPAVQNILERWFRNAAMECEIYGDAERALEALANGSFDAVLFDVTLPGITGFEAIEKVKAVSDVPVLLMSGHADEEFRKDAEALGAKGLFAKPLDFDLLTQTLKSIARG